MVRLVKESWRLQRQRSRFHIGDVYWWHRQLGHDGPNPDIRLWYRGAETLVGFAWHYPGSAGEIQVHPDQQGSGLAEEMLEWMEQRSLQVAATRGNKPKLETWDGNDSGFRSILDRRGYVPTGHDTAHFWRHLDDIEAIAPPAGFHVRNVRGEEEAEARDAVAGRAFGRPTQTHIYVNAMRMPGYGKELDLVAEADDGMLAAYSNCWIDTDNRVGEFEPVGCDPLYRRRGLTKAVLNEGLRRLRDFGAGSAVVYAESGNSPAMRLYESCGFRRVWTDSGFAREL